MLLLKTTVPDAVLIEHSKHSLEDQMRQQAAHWLHIAADTLDYSPDGSTVLGLRSNSSGICATVAVPNTGNSVFNEQGLAFEEGINSGFALPCAEGVGDEYSYAVRFVSGEKKARTLLTLNPRKSDNYLFLRQLDESIVLKDQKSTLEIAIPFSADTGTSCLVIVGHSAGTYSLSLPDTGKETVAATVLTTMNGPSDLFIGCRSNRKGLYNTLGSFSLQDVFFWPDRNILSEDNTDTLETLNAYSMWET